MACFARTCATPTTTQPLHNHFPLVRFPPRPLSNLVRFPTSSFFVRPPSASQPQQDKTEGAYPPTTAGRSRQRRALCGVQICRALKSFASEVPRIVHAKVAYPRHVRYLSRNTPTRTLEEKANVQFLNLILNRKKLLRRENESETRQICREKLPPDLYKCGGKQQW